MTKSSTPLGSNDLPGGVTFETLREVGDYVLRLPDAERESDLAAKAGPAVFCKTAGDFKSSLLLLALLMSLFSVLMGRLRMLFRRVRELLTLGMISRAVLLGSGPVSLGSVFVVLRSFVVIFLGHIVLPKLCSQRRLKLGTA